MFIKANLQSVNVKFYLCKAEEESDPAAKFKSVVDRTLQFYHTRRTLAGFVRWIWTTLCL